PAVLQRQEKRHAIKEAEQQRRPDRKKRAGNISNDKNEEGDVHGRDSVPIHRYPWADKQNRRRYRPDQIPEHGASKKEKCISKRTTRRSWPQINAPGDNEERTNNNHEGRVLHCCMNNTPWLLQHQEVVKTNNAGERETELFIVPLPMMLCNQRAKCDRQQQDCEWHHRESIRLSCNKTQDRHYAIWDDRQKPGKPNSLDSCRCQREVSGFKLKQEEIYGDTNELGGLGRQSQGRERNNESGAQCL